MANRRVGETPRTRASEAPSEGPIVRIRHLLLLGLVGMLAWGLYPRAKAAWQLHDQATDFANYGLCMVGPIGPSKLRDQPAEFYALVRQRLLVASATSRPFSECAPLAENLGGEALGELHELAADQFVEYAGPGQPIASLEQLRVSVQILADLAERAWPFERGGYAKLIKPSSHAKEAAHPVPFERPTVGSGLPGWRAAYHTIWQHQGRLLLAVGHSGNLQVLASGDGGLNWQPTSLSQPGMGRHAGRCMATGQPRSFTFHVESDGLAVTSLSGDEAIFRSHVRGLEGVINASCDSRSALLVGPAKSAQPGPSKPAEIGLFLCRHGGGCGRIATQPHWFEGQFDIARVAGVSVVVTERGGVVRVRTSRDDGASWTPPTVAFDRLSHPDVRVEVAAPTRLLVAGQRLLLFGAGKQGQRYPLLVSDDFGASFRAPLAARAPAAQAASGAERQARQGTADPIVGVGAGQHRIQ